MFCYFGRRISAKIAPLQVGTDLFGKMPFTLIEIILASIISSIVLLGIIQTSVSLLKNKQTTVNNAMLSEYANNILHHTSWLQKHFVSFNKL